MKGSSDSAVLLQMQVIPKLDNVFYYTFKEPGTYFIRCLEYCGYAHPYMTSIVTVLPAATGGGGGAT
jgi:cytochrome c oxidase subunit 2